MTRIVKVGNLSIGGNNPIIIQSMTNTNSADVEATVKQINELEKAGCQLVRMTINNVKAAEAIKEIKKRVNLPLVADIHFDYRLALLAIENGIDKLRINPGNIGSDENVKKVVEAAKEKNIPIRIGVNSGSIEKEILEKYDTIAQSSKMREERLQSQQCFKVKDKVTLPAKILLIDDIYTTGATLQLAKDILVEAGVKEILTFSLAR